MRAHLLTIGDELLIGQTTNTNAAWLGEQLSLMGVKIDRVVTMPDEPDAIRTELDRAYADVPLVVTTGGLGPTHDDVTKRIVADYFGRAMHTDEELLERVRRYYDRRERGMPEEVTSLAQVPDGFELLENPVGTAAGLWYTDTSADRERLLAVLPGVPQEMKSIFSAAVEPRLEARADVRDVQHRTLRTTGIGESDLQATIGDLSDWLDGDLRLAYLPSTSGVRLRITAHGTDPDDAQARIDALEAVLRERAGRYIYGTGDDTLEGVLGTMLRERGLTVATAESATGGLIGHRLTNESGSSDYFLGSVVSYANAVKVNGLGVSEADLEAHGAVSEPVARQMARGVRDALDADVAVSTTGIAGPTGGTKEKPVGTVWVGYADADTEHARCLHLTQDRHLNKALFATAALDMIRRQLRRKEAPAPPDRA
jgi:nicotinamide-nucleotide amidase